MSRPVLSDAPGPGLPAAARLLMCPPTAYALRYEINPWMSIANLPDTVLAATQWRHLREVLTQRMGAQAELATQAEECPDMVFSANAGLVRGGRAALARFRHPERQAEEPHWRAWFEEQGFQVAIPPPGVRFEGEGDALFAGDVLLAGYLKRSDIAGHSWLAELFGLEVLSLELTDDRWYHLDTCLFALSPGTIVYYPGAFDRYGRTVLEGNFETIHVEEAEALRFACNAVVIGRHVALPAGCPALCAALAARGYETHSVELSEFLKAGGAAKCLALFLKAAAED